MARRLYLSGPVSGQPDSNRPAFAAAAEALRLRGYDVLCPTELGRLPEDEGGREALWVRYLRRDLIAMLSDPPCEGVALLPGWEASRGARLERTVAQAVGIEVHPVGVWVRSAEPVAAVPVPVEV